MTAKGTSINAKTSPARALNPVSNMAGGGEYAERPHWGHAERCARVLEDSSVETAMIVLLVLLRESLSIV